ncbi:MAG TPA: asparagine synthase (glutamine-hydrolyzing) [Solirubrobacterales bacterium]|jgi:asparagine synthase (glutamine-hydrolysing)|nr:asparagine synthase (glutamine-hydrolyzing) [Solirubrobacterales bacterium]
MCGICGVVAGEREGTPDLEAVGRMSRRLVHRGPDDDGLFHDGPVALAARRLSIIDLAHGHQPIANEDGSVVVVQNGEIYNHRELKRELQGRGHRFATDCDTEVLAHLYEDEGEGFVERLRGMFAIAIWDRRRERLLLARDRFGIKPLYYRSAAGGISFASELKAMLEQPGFSREIDPRAVAAYLAFNSIPAPLTIFAEARKLPPGHLLSWQGGEIALRRYARPAPVAAEEVRREPIEELAAELREVLDDSVAAHLLADVPVGVLLSGGVDSGGIAALASAHTDEPLRTFSIGFEEGGFDELDRARLVAERYGTDHHELILRPDAVDLLSKLVESFDEPFGDSSALPTYLVSELAAGHVKVALSGEGGDELFGGYYTYVADLLAPRVGRLAALAAPLAEALPSRHDRVGFDYKAKRFARAAAKADPLERHHAWKEIFAPETRVALAGGGASGWDPVDLYRERYAETVSAEPLARMQDVDLGIYLVDDLLVKTDRLSMAHSLELRVPFLDPRVAEFAMALPTRMKVRGFAKKRLLRRALAPLLPKQIVHGRKQGFSIPLAAWLRGPLEPFAREVLAPSTLERQGLLAPAAVAPLLDRHLAGREDLSRQIWGLMALTLWFDRYASD